MTVLLKVENLVKHYVAARSMFGRPMAFVKAVDGVSFALDAGETLALVGESGCGKSTVSRLILRLIEPDAGSIHFAGRDLLKMNATELRSFRRDAQIIFQDPYASLNPRMTVGQILAEPLALHDLVPSAGRRDRVEELLRLVGLEPRFARRYAHEFSGGQRQRIAIARAVIRNSPILILDEPSSGLDASSEQLVFEALDRLMEGKTSIVIAHRLSTIRRADQILVVQDGEIVERGRHEQLLEAGGLYAHLHEIQFRGEENLTSP